MRLPYVGEKKQKKWNTHSCFWVLCIALHLCIMWEDYDGLPNIKTLTRLTSKVKTLADMSYMQNVFPNWMMKGRNIVNYWWSLHEANFAVLYDIAFGSKIANTVLSFMLICLSGDLNSHVESFLILNPWTWCYWVDWSI